MHARTHSPVPNSHSHTLPHLTPDSTLTLHPHSRDPNTPTPHVSTPTPTTHTAHTLHTHSHHPTLPHSHPAAPTSCTLTHVTPPTHTPHTQHPRSHTVHTLSHDPTLTHVVPQHPHSHPAHIHTTPHSHTLYVPTTHNFVFTYTPHTPTPLTHCTRTHGPHHTPRPQAVPLCTLRYNARTLKFTRGFSVPAQPLIAEGPSEDSWGRASQGRELIVVIRERFLSFAFALRMPDLSAPRRRTARVFSPSDCWMGNGSGRVGKAPRPPCLQVEQRDFSGSCSN